MRPGKAYFSLVSLSPFKEGRVRIHMNDHPQTLHIAYFYNQIVCMDIIIDNLNVLSTSYIKYKGLLVSVSHAFKKLILIFNAPNSHLNLER